LNQPNQSIIRFHEGDKCYWGAVEKISANPKKGLLLIRLLIVVKEQGWMHDAASAYFGEVYGGLVNQVKIEFIQEASVSNLSSYKLLISNTLKSYDATACSIVDESGIYMGDDRPAIHLLQSHAKSKDHLISCLEACGIMNISVKYDKVEPDSRKKRRVTWGKPEHRPLTRIIEIGELTGNVRIEGDVLNCQTLNVRSGKGMLYIFDVTDYSSSITCSVFTQKEDEALNEIIAAGNRVFVEGYAVANDRSGEIRIKASGLELGEAPVITDDSACKRIELHCHTKLSSMDSLCELEDLIKHASGLGHRALAITDHGVVQAFPEAAQYGIKYGIKIIYGIECYLYDDSQSFLSGDADSFDDEYVVFDLETTGLNPNTDTIIEIGAVRIKDRKIIDRFSTFVNPGRPIPQNITRITGINDGMVKDAPKPNEALPAFLHFIGSSALAAHNAEFDISFVKKLSDKNGMSFHRPHIDTLGFSRLMLPALKSHRLDKVAAMLNVSLENHHRAVDDAQAAAEILIKLFNIAEKSGAESLSQVKERFNSGRITRDNVYHAILLAQNKKGLRNLYELVSISHMKYTTRGKPHIPKSMLSGFREGLLVGSACEQGEVFQAILKNKPEKDIRQTAEFYDYLEVQPLGNNEFLVREEVVKNTEALIGINKKIIELGDQMGKPVVATCDVHFLFPKDEYFRRILMHGQKFPDADQQAPLYYRTTGQMLDEFRYLDEKKAYEIIVENTHRICSLIEDFEPLPEEKLYAPHIEGAKEQVISLSYETAYKIYGDPLPEIVRARLEKELGSITGYGFSVLYLIAHKLVKKSNDDGYLVGSRGSVGSSLVATLMGITEVNPLKPHYTCSNCLYSDFDTDPIYACGPDLPDKTCPNCGSNLVKRGFDIPFEVFLGFKGDKVPDIDLNFSGEYQSVVHKYTEDLLDAKNVFRAGTISKLADKTAYGFVKSYLDEKGVTASRAEVDRLVQGCAGVKRTTGQHPGGIIVVPSEYSIYDFTPIQYPADDKSAGVITTHFDFKSLHDRLVKLDLLGHDDPTMLKMLQDLTGIDPKEIPLDDKKVLSLFTSPQALGVTPEDIGSDTGTLGIPEFGTNFVRTSILKDTMPTTVAELIRISGLSHGTGVWLGNAQELIRSKTATLREAICTRDDIMNYLISMHMEPKMAFDIMERVRKGKGLNENMEAAMVEANVPEWFINSCKLIKYMFPKAHAVAYVIMGLRIAYYKVYYPLAYYAAYFTVRADEFDASIMTGSIDELNKQRAALDERSSSDSQSTAKDKNVLTILEMVIEMRMRGIEFAKVDIYKSHASKFTIDGGNILPSLTSMPGLGETVAEAIMREAKKGRFTSVRQMQQRTGANKAVIGILKEQGCLDGLPDSDQVSMFEML